ncbi:CocE/NonD family hydrolase [Nocardioidaceae bacterium SCSIO 66511]|nr:CocE/NonD family hydrolase [Nocardioidaceae bacterium SCSIO 66511]
MSVDLNAGRQASEHDEIVVDWDVQVPTRDGLELRADVFRPREVGDYPVILAMGPYGKGLNFEEGFPANWRRMIEAYPEVAEDTSNRFQNWEMVDPEKWVPDGYVCVRVDSRGAGRSRGLLDVFSQLEARDYYDCIEWAGVQPWSNGRVGLLGISYYATNQWHVAALQPPHLSAICVWEGFADYYRDAARHGGILSGFLEGWFNRQVARVQHGVADRGFRDPNTGYAVAGDEQLSERALRENRVDPGEHARDRRLDGAYYAERTPDLSRINVPLFSAGNWGGMGLHTRGNIEGFLAVGSQEKWLEMHGDTHFSPFYTDRGVSLQKQFFGTFLKDEDNGWRERPAVELLIRHPGERFVSRFEASWPLPDTNWTRFYLDPHTMSLAREPRPGAPLEYQTMGAGLRFSLPVVDHDREFTGHSAVRMRVSSQTSDADIFVALQLFDPDGEEVTFIGSNDPKVPVGLGWLRASHRALDTERSTFYRPYHTHSDPQPLEPGVPVDVDVEIWPTCIVVPAGYRLELAIRGCDYKNSGSSLDDAMYEMRGVGPFVHVDETDRPASVFDTVATLHFDEDEPPYLLLPEIDTGR